ncbi:MAG: MBL fold metallo-hydrolase [Myxococcota bacterium]
MATTPLHQLRDGRVELLGAVSCVTGAMSRVELGGSALLVDCGVPQGRDKAGWSFPDAARDVDAVVLTHGHLDHIGSLPALLNGGYDRPVFATAATLAIARLSLEDALEMQGASPREVSAFLARLDEISVALPYDELREHSAVPRVRFAFREAGHILGSASVEILSAKSRVILSGDLGRPHSPLLREPCTTWSAEQPVDLVVMESTYGSRDHEHGHDDIERELGQAVQRAVDRSGKVFIPAFAIGRTQVLLYHLNALVESGRVPAVPVAVDTPLGLVVTDVHQRFRRLYDKESLARLARGDDPLDFADLYGVERARDSRRLREMPGPLVVIAGSGMLTGGRILGHLAEGLSDERNTLLFAGYQAEGTLGRRIQQAGKRGGRVSVDGAEVPVRASIGTLRGLSAHADRGELLAWLRAIPGVQRVALHHGDASAQRDFVSWAQELPQ